MKHNPFNALTAAALTAAMVLSSFPATESTTADAADSEDVIFSTDFEDGDVSKFSKR